LFSLPEMAKAQHVAPLALLIVGEVVRLRAKLAWFGGGREQSVDPERRVL
jgi:siroheme synthase